MKPLFSIVVPVYNVENYLRRCLDSIVNQEFRDFECILVNDGSTDESSKILDEYGKKYEFLKVIHQKNKGVSAARNTGIVNSNGKYLVFVDSDDFIEKDTLEEFYRCVNSFNYPDIVICGYRELYQNSVKENNYNDAEIEQIRINYLTETWGLSVCNKCFVRELFNDDLFPEGLLYEDYYLLPKLMYKAKSIKVISGAFYNYDKTVENSITRQLDSKHRYFKFKAKYITELIAFEKCTEVYKICEKKTIAEARRCMFKYYFDKMLDDTQVIEIKQYLQNKKLIGKNKFWIDRILQDDIFICKIYSLLKGYN